MKKGFTLVELLGTIILITIIGIIVFPVVSYTLKRGKENAYNAQIKIIIESANKWGIANPNLLPEIDTNDRVFVTLNDLIQGGYIEIKDDEDKLYNPLTNEELTGCILITYSSEYNQYIYEYTEECY